MSDFDPSKWPDLGPDEYWTAVCVGDERCHGYSSQDPLAAAADFFAQFNKDYGIDGEPPRECELWLFRPYGRFSCEQDWKARAEILLETEEEWSFGHLGEDIEWDITPGCKDRDGQEAVAQLGRDMREAFKKYLESIGQFPGNVFTIAETRVVTREQVIAWQVTRGPTGGKDL